MVCPKSPRTSKRPRTVGTISWTAKRSAPCQAASCDDCSGRERWFRTPLFGGQAWLTGCPHGAGGRRSETSPGADCSRSRAPATPPRETPPSGAVARTRATAAASPDRRRSSKWRAQFVAVCVLAALALLVSGVGIGLLLRSPADKTSDERRVAVQKDDQPPGSTRSSTDRPRSAADDSPSSLGRCSPCSTRSTDQDRRLRDRTV